MDDVVKELLFRIRASTKPLPIDIYIQPIFDLSSYKVLGGEILARGFSHGDIVPFKDIITHLNNHEIMMSVGTHIINLTCSFIQKEKIKDIFFSINISHLQLQHKKFSSIIEKALSNYNVNAKLLMIEVTCDDSMLDDIAIENLTKIEERGVKVAWDNISTKSQLYSLQSKFKAGSIKIKPGRISDEKTSEIHSIIDFTKINGIDIIAERLETMKQSSIFLKKNIQKGQGYIYSRAISKMEFKNKYITKS